MTDEERGANRVDVKSEVAVACSTGQEITDFLLDPRDDRYQDWWPGTHREFHILERCSRAGHVGDVVLMDEYIGPRHVRMTAEVIEAIPGEKLVWQLRRWRLRLPIRLTLSLQDRRRGRAPQPHHHLGLVRARRRLRPVAEALLLAVLRE